PRWEPRLLTRPSRGSLCPEVTPWAELGAPAVPPAPSRGKRWRSAPAGRSESRCEGVPEPAVRQEELPAVEPQVLAEQVEHEPEVLVTSGPDLPAAAVEAGTAAASAGTAGEAGTAAGNAGVAGVEGECCCRKQRGQSSSSCPPSPGACAQC